jgi:hypothetical protein
MQGWFTVLVVVPAVNELIEKMREGWAEKWNTLSLETEYVEVQCSNLSVGRALGTRMASLSTTNTISQPNAASLTATRLQTDL